MKLPEFLNKLKTGVETKVKANISRLLYKKDKELIVLLKEHSPYDPDSKSSHFRDNWKASRKKFGKSGILAEIIVINNTPIYGQFLVTGAEPNEAPWYYPHRNKKTGRFKKGTGKLKLSNGKVWAGGLDPGHSKTIGGPIFQVLSKFSDKVSQEVSSEFVKGFI